MLPVWISQNLFEERLQEERSILSTNLFSLITHILVDSWMQIILMDLSEG